MKALSRIGILASMALFVSFASINAAESCNGCKDKKGDCKEKHKMMGEKKGEGKHGKMSQEERGDRIAKELGLTDAQKVKVAEIRKAHSEKVKAQQEKNRAEMKALLDTMHEEMKTVLTDEQKVKFEKHLAERKDGKMKRKEHGKKECDKK